MRFIDLTGQKFNRLTVVKRAESHIKPNGAKVAQWWCSCDCGNPDLVLVSGSNLTSGHTKSCGCLKSEQSAKNGKKLKGKSNLKNKKYNLYNLLGEYGVGYLNNGKEFYFDLEDYDLIKNYCWWENDNGYLLTSFTSGVTGVFKRGNKWCASIMVDYKPIPLGSFDDFDDAVKARKDGEEKYFGEFSYDNSMKHITGG